MALNNIAIFVFFMVATIRASMAVVHTVGGQKGWRIAGDNFYNDWASRDKPFQIGDVLVFQYDPKGHNVIQVSRQDYESCTTSSPIATFTSGKDNINIAESATYYYICGFPGHCKAGMKFNFDVAGTPASNSPNGTSAAPSSLKCPAGGQDQSFVINASSELSSNWLIATLLGLSAVVGFGFAF